MAGEQFPYFAGGKATKGYQVFAGIVTVLSLIEFFLFTLAFLYTLVRTAIYQTWGGRAISVGIGLFFVFMRMFALVLLVANVPLPNGLNHVGYPRLISGSLWTLGVIFFIVLALQMIIVVGHEILRQYRKSKRTHPLSIKDSRKAYVAVIIPIYNEDSAMLWRTITSVVDNKYPHEKMNLILAFDDIRESPLFNSIKWAIEKDEETVFLGEDDISEETQGRSSRTYNDRHFINLYKYKGIIISLCRFAHEGKRATQNKAFAVAEKWYKGVCDDKKVPFKRDPRKHHQIFLTELIILFIDSDVALHKLCIAQMEHSMRENPDKRAITGLILCSIPNTNALWILQEIEYVQAQMIDRVVESALGGVTCLPGALTMIRYHAIKEVAPLYFGWKTDNQLDTFEYAKYFLGEDRYLTSLLLDSSKHKSEISFCEEAMSETVAPGSLGTFIKQRRRWFLGTLANEAQLITSPISYQMYPFLTIYRLFMLATRSLSLLYYLLIISIIIDHKPIWALVTAIVVPIVFNWVAVGYYGITLKSYCCLLYPILHVIFPIYQWIITCYSILTCYKQTWGGPRTDAIETNAAYTEGQFGPVSKSGFTNENPPIVVHDDSFASEKVYNEVGVIGKYADTSFTSVSDGSSGHGQYPQPRIRSYYDDDYNKDVNEYPAAHRYDADNNSVTTITAVGNGGLLTAVGNAMINEAKRNQNRISMMARFDEDNASLESSTSQTTIIPNKRTSSRYSETSYDGSNSQRRPSIPNSNAMYPPIEIGYNNDLPSNMMVYPQSSYEVSKNNGKGSNYDYDLSLYTNASKANEDSMDPFYPGKPSQGARVYTEVPKVRNPVRPNRNESTRAADESFTSQRSFNEVSRNGSSGSSRAPGRIDAKWAATLVDYSASADSTPTITSPTRRSQRIASRMADRDLGQNIEEEVSSPYISPTGGSNPRRR